MHLLLDTHTLLWLLAEPERLKEEARLALDDPANDPVFSPISVWEIEIKVAIGKLARPVPDVVSSTLMLGLIELPVTARHATAVGTLPLHHSDPFDRLLIAQARTEGMTLVTRDRAFSRYEVSTLAC